MTVQASKTLDLDVIRGLTNSLLADKKPAEVYIHKLLLPITYTLNSLKTSSSFIKICLSCSAFLSHLWFLSLTFFTQYIGCPLFGFVQFLQAVDFLLACRENVNKEMTSDKVDNLVDPIQVKIKCIFKHICFVYTIVQRWI